MFLLQWSLFGYGRELGSGELFEQRDRLKLAPFEEVFVTVNLASLLSTRERADQEYWLDVSFRLNKDTCWATQQHEVAWEQIVLPVRNEYAQKKDEEIHEMLSLVESEEYITVEGKTCFRVSKLDGSIVYFGESGEQETTRSDSLLWGDCNPTLNVWRAPTDNDDAGAAR